MSWGVLSWILNKNRQFLKAKSEVVSADTSAEALATINISNCSVTSFFYLDFNLLCKYIWVGMFANLLLGAHLEIWSLQLQKLREERGKHYSNLSMVIGSHPRMLVHVPYFTRNDSIQPSSPQVSEHVLAELLFETGAFLGHPLQDVYHLIQTVYGAKWEAYHCSNETAKLGICWWIRVNLGHNLLQTILKMA